MSIQDSIEAVLDDLYKLKEDEFQEHSLNKAAMRLLTPFIDTRLGYDAKIKKLDEEIAAGKSTITTFKKYNKSKKDKKRTAPIIGDIKKKNEQFIAEKKRLADEEGNKGERLYKAFQQARQMREEQNMDEYNQRLYDRVELDQLDSAWKRIFPNNEDFDVTKIYKAYD